MKAQGEMPVFLKLTSNPPPWGWANFFLEEMSFDKNTMLVGYGKRVYFSHGG